MLQRGMAGALRAPLGNTDPGYRAPPRRAAPRYALARRFSGSLMAPQKEYRVQLLAHGRYRLITIITIEEVVTREKLAELGLEIPAMDVPWTEGAEPVRVWHRAHVPANPDLVAALEYWSLRVGGPNHQLRSRLPHFLKEFGLAPVREAIDIVAVNAAHMSASDKYLMLVRVFREMRERAGGAR